MGNIGVKELLLVLVIVILLFGAKKIPELARGLGIGIKEFRKASSEIEKDIESDSGDNSSKEEKKEESIKQD